MVWFFRGIIQYSIQSRGKKDCLPRFVLNRMEFKMIDEMKLLAAHVPVPPCPCVPMFWCTSALLSRVSVPQCPGVLVGQRNNQRAPPLIVSLSKKNAQFLGNTHTWTEVDIELVPSENKWSIYVQGLNIIAFSLKL